MIGLPEASCLLAARCCPRHQRAASLARAHSQRTSRLAFTLAPRLHTSQVRFNGHEDPMTFGSASVGADVDFPLASHLYGLPERAMDLALPPTLGREPYRLMNLDVFEFLLDHPMGLYGSVPFLHAAGPAGAQGVLWLNPSETWVDVGCQAAEGAGGAEGAEGAEGACSHFFSAAGVIDAFLFHGAAPPDVTRQHAALTGTTPLPPYSALGYTSAARTIATSRMCVRFTQPSRSTRCPSMSSGSTSSTPTASGISHGIRTSSRSRAN